MKRNNFGSTIWLFFLLTSLSLIISLFGTNSTSSAQTPKPTPVLPPTPIQGVGVDGSESTNHPQTNRDIITVSSTAGWVNTLLSVQPGDQFTISYISGSWTVDYRNFSYVGPNGYPYYEDSQIASGCKQVPVLPYARLIGAIGGGSAFDVAVGRTFTAGNSGFLFLRINDMDPCLVDNDGSVVVELTYESDTTAPTVYWVSPVENGQTHEVSSGTVDLEVSAGDDTGVTRVEFSRWDTVNATWIHFYTDYSAPYETMVEVDTLNMEWNQIVAYAFDEAGNAGFGEIWIFRTSTPDLRQNGEIVVSGDLHEGGTVYLSIPVFNFGVGHSPAMHVYTEGLTASGALWRADGADPTAVVLDPGEGEVITVQHELWSGEVGWWDTSIGVFIWNDDTSAYYGPLDANGYDQHVDFYVEGAGPDLRQDGEIAISGDLIEGGTVYLTIPVKNFGSGHSPAMHVYTEGHTANGDLWRADGAQPTAVVLQPGESVEITVQHELWSGHVGWWDTSGGVHIWNDDTSGWYGPLNANGYNQNVDFYVEAATSDLRQNGEIAISGDLHEGGTVYLTIPVKNFGNAASPVMHVYTEGYTANGDLWRADDAQPTAVVLQPGESVEITVQHELWSGHVGFWDTSRGVYIWNDDTSSYYGPLDPNGHNQNVRFYVTTAEDSGINLSISLFKTATASERTVYEAIMGHFADAIFEMTNGVHRVGQITFYQNGQNRNISDVWWNSNEWPRAHVSAYYHDGLPLYMGDIFPFDSPYNALEPNNWCGAGYTLGHEWGHYSYGLYDEYATNPPEDVSASPAVMASQWDACSGNLNALNFSTPLSVNGPHNNWRAYEASSWEILARPPSADPDTEMLRGGRIRHHYPELASVATVNRNLPPIELPSNLSRSELSINWITPSAPNQYQSNNDIYHPFVFSSQGESISSPSPMKIFAGITNETAPLTDVNIEATVSQPNTTTKDLTFRDDGVAPDFIAGDGLYTTIFGYTQEGEHVIHVAINNSNQSAIETQEAYNHTPPISGRYYHEIPQTPPDPITDLFDVEKETRICVNTCNFNGSFIPILIKS